MSLRVSSLYMANRNTLLIGSSITVMLLGILVMLGWVFNIPFFTSVFHGFATMKFNTALSFFLSGLAFYLILRQDQRMVVTFVKYAAVTIVGVLGLVSLSQYLFVYDAGVDQFFVRDNPDIVENLPFPGRMAPMSCICFILMSVALPMIRAKQRSERFLAQCMLHIVTFVAFVAVVGYFFTVPALYKLAFLTSVSIHTALAFILISVAASWVNDDLGIPAMFVGDKMGNIMARQLFPMIVAMVLVVGFLRILSHRHNIVTVEFGIALSSVTFCMLGLLLIYQTSISLNRIDRRRRVAEQEVQELNKHLEKTVKVRTEHLSEALNKILQSETALHTAKRDLERLLIDLTERNRQLMDFAQITSHNLRAPVSNLLTLVAFHKESEDPDEKGMLFGKIETVTSHLSVILNELVEVLRIREGGKITLEQISFQHTLDKVKEMISGQIMFAHAVIECDFSAAPSILYSKLYLESIVLNLLSNAIKYRSEDRPPYIFITTAEGGDGSVIFRITDNGLGIDMTRHGEKLFGLHKTFHRHPDAKGLGLFMTKAQVEALGGKIFAESEVDKGTTFTITFRQGKDDKTIHDLHH